MPPTDAPIFVLSCPRSGSTLLRYILDTHPEVASPPELDLGSLTASLCRTLESSLALTVPTELRTLFVAAEAERVVSSLLGRYAEARGKRRWCEKSPHDNLEHLEVLSGVFPEAHYVCLHRHVMDFAHSVLEANRYRWWPFLQPWLVAHGYSPVAATVAYWIAQTRQLLGFEERGRHTCHRVRYEDLVARPHEVVGGLLRFLELAPDPDLLGRVFETAHDEGGGDTKIRFHRSIDPRSVGKGASLPLSLLGAELRAAANELLGALGYPPLEDDFNARPPAHRSDTLEPEAAVATPPESPALVEAFERRLQASLAARPSAFARLRACFRIAIEGAADAEWTLDLRTGPGVLERGAPLVEDCAVVLAPEILEGILAGVVHPQEAFLRGDIRVRGDEDLAAALGALL